MNEREDFIVRKPYKPTDEEERAIKELENNGFDSSDWDSDMKGIKSFKKNLRQDMYRKQNKLCAYCRVHVPIACEPLHREHIVHKNEHPQWMFLPENLCISCYWCNVYKGTTEVLENPQTTEYPKSGNGFKIIQPLYDKFSDHIELLGDVLYRGKTEKGIFTIETCHLYRVDLAEERVDMKMLADNKGKVIAELIGLTKEVDQYVDEKYRLCQYVKKIVDRYKEKHMTRTNHE